MAKTLFDLLNDVTYNKIPWAEQTDADKKAFSPYMVNRFLSMNLEYLELVAEIQKHTATLDSGIVYSIYHDLLPKKKSYAKYISADKDSEQSYDDLINFLVKKHNISSKECAENLDLIIKTNKLGELREYLKNHGFKDEELQRLFKEKKQHGKKK